MNSFIFKTYDHPAKSDVDGNIFALAFTLADQGGSLMIEMGQETFEKLKDLVMEMAKESS